MINNIFVIFKRTVIKLNCIIGNTKATIDQINICKPTKLKQCFISIVRSFSNLIRKKV